MAQLEKFIKVTQEQYNTLQAGGTVGSHTGINPNFIYLVENNGSSESSAVDETYVADALSNFMADEIEPKLEDKQDTLVSGTNIKTINGTSILGSGNISIEGGSGSGSAGSLIIEKQAETLDDGHIRIQFTQNELDQLKNDPNAIVRTHLLSLNVDFKQLLPSANSALVTSLKFYTELSNGVFVLTASEDDPLIYSSSKVSGHLFGSGSLIIEKELILETDPYFTLTEDEYLQLAGDPNGMIKLSGDGSSLFFKQLLPVAIADSTSGNVTPSLKFYSEFIIEDVNVTENLYYVFSASAGDPSKYYLSIQENLFEGSSGQEIIMADMSWITGMDGTIMTGTIPAEYRDIERLKQAIIVVPTEEGEAQAFRYEFHEDPNYFFVFAAPLNRSWYSTARVIVDIDSWNFTCEAI